MREHCTRYRFYAPALLPAVFVLVAFAFAVSPAYAQTGQGTITGTVTDSSGAVIPAVNVQLSSARTGFTYSATTNVEGLFRVPYLNAGEYTVTFEAQGFKRLVRSAVQVRSTETLQLNAALEIGDLVESVEVSAMATLLEAETSATGHLVTGEQLVKLPSPQMKIESMLFYVAGVTSQRSNAHSAGGRTGKPVLG